jgi:hypothetical protein
VELGLVGDGLPDGVALWGLVAPRRAFAALAAFGFAIGAGDFFFPWCLGKRVREAEQAGE